ncbi:unnamed protein product [Allacma fusca]|uniref:Ig-like domain-containing protein n=1 Tax=Allacma fusca TaxID=39272 RepID=A0A8J2PRZ9_9HEXA|nr:unnamed protein product [Allacma fusca]
MKSFIFTKKVIILIIILGLYHASQVVDPLITHEDIIRRNAIAEEENVWTDINEKASILCKTHNSQKIRYCFWRKDPQHNNLEVFPHEGQIIPGYVHYGDGFDRGDCGITIEKVQEEDFGNWMCDLITETETLLGQVALTRWEIPPLSLKPEILRKEEFKSLRDSESVADTPRASQNIRNITCCIEPLGKPPPSVHFKIGSIIIARSTLVHFTDESKRECVVWNDAVFTHRDNGHTLRCEMTHISFKKNSSDIYDSVRLNVEFPPNLENLLEDNTIVIGNLEGGFDILVNVHANPYPHLNLTLESKGDNKGPAEIMESARSHNIHTYRTNTSDEKVEVLVRLFDVKKMQDGDKITLFASNLLGKANVTFTFVAEEFKINDTLSVVLFITISLLLLAIIFIVIAWIIGDRRRRSSNLTTITSLKYAANRVSSGDYRTADEIAPVI